MMYFFDTYAFIEIFNGNPKYDKYKRTEFATTKLNIMEVYYWLLNNFNKKVAEDFYNNMVKFCVEITDSVIKEAVQFRFENKSRDLSYIDCLGYILAKANGLKFLTGDREFKGMSNVEFVR